MTVLLGSCGLAPGAFPEPSPALDQRLYDVTADPTGEARLVDLTDFGWERVVVFVGYEDADSVNARIGQRVLWWPSGQFEENGALLVFLAAGGPVEVVSLPSNRLRTGFTDEFGRGARVVHEARYDIRIVEP